MNNPIVRIYRIMFILGGIIAFISCFIEWYHIEVLTEAGQVVLECSYNLFMGWEITDRIYLGALDMFYPESPSIAIEFLFLHLGITIISALLAIFKGSLTLQDSQKSKPAIYLLLANTMMTLVMVLYFSVELFFKNGMHVPTLVINDQILEVVIHQRIGMGYILHLVSFMFLFSFAWFRFRMSVHFEMVKEEGTQNDAIICLNLDRLIAEENIRKISKRSSNFTQIRKDKELIASKYESRRSNR